MQDIIIKCLHVRIKELKTTNNNVINRVVVGVTETPEDVLFIFVLCGSTSPVTHPCFHPSLFTSVEWRNTFVIIAAKAPAILSFRGGGGSSATLFFNTVSLVIEL